MKSNLRFGLSFFIIASVMLLGSSFNQESFATHQAEFMTPSDITTHPDAVTDLRAVAGDSQVTLHWTAPNNGGSPIIKYSVWWFGSLGPQQQEYYNPIDTTMTITGLVNDEEYSFLMMSINSAGWSNEFHAWSERSNAAVGTPISSVIITDPQHPTNFRATPGDSQVILSWDEPNNGGSPITQYYVWWYDTAGNKQYNYYDNSNGPMITITGLDNDEQYRFKIMTITEHGKSNASLTVTVTPTSPMIVTDPNPPSDFTAITGNSKVDLSWTEPNNGGSPIISYYVWWYDGEGNKDYFYYDNPTGTTITIPALTNGEEYRFKIMTITEHGRSNASLTLLVTPAPPVAEIYPLAPNDLRAISGNQQVTLRWTEAYTGSSPLILYYVYWLDSAGNRDSFTYHNPTDSELIITGLTNGEEYRFNMIPQSSVGRANTSNEVTVTPN